jgi:hypothetical protein
VAINGTGFGVSPVVHFAGSPDPAVLVSHTATKIVATVPADARNGNISVTTAHNVTVGPALFKPLLKITGFDAANYQAGDIVTVNGTNFLANGLPTARLGANPVAVLSPTDTSFQFVVPDNGLTALVTVANGNGTAASPTTLKVRPTITSGPLPNEAAAATHLTITGKTFTGTTSVKFNGTVPAPFTVRTGGTSLDVTVPTTGQSGPISVTNAGGTATTGIFTIDPRITSFGPLSGSIGTLITVHGSGLLGADRVDFAGGFSAVPTNATASSLNVVVPPGTTTGHLSIHTPAGSSPPSAQTLTVTSSVTSIAPTRGDDTTDATVTGAVKVAQALLPLHGNSHSHIHGPPLDNRERLRRRRDCSFELDSFLAVQHRGEAVAVHPDRGHDHHAKLVVDGHTAKRSSFASRLRV